jgi:hypothetical protein
MQEAAETTFLKALLMFCQLAASQYASSKHLGANGLLQEEIWEPSARATRARATCTH